MPNKMLIDATHPEETRVVVVRGNRVEEFDFESANRKQLRGNIYLAKVTRVEPSLQAAFIDYGGNRHGFLAFSEIHPDYYQIPVADRQALIEEEERAARAADAEADNRARRSHRPSRSDRHRDSARSAPVEAGSTEADSDDSCAMMALSEATAPLAGEAASERADSPAAEQSAATEAAAEEIRPAAETPPAPPSDLPTPVDEVLTSASEAPIDLAALESHASAEPVPSGDHHHHFDHSEAEHIHQSERYSESAEATETGDVTHADSESADGGANVTEVNGNGDGGEDEVIELVGGADAMEEVPERMHRSRRQYKIQEVIKRRQVMLVQVVKEERGTKGAALTTYLSLAGRYSVLMPNTARGGGISRKITSAEDRRRLKDIAQELEVPEGMGVILRTAGAARTKTEVKRDFEYLLRLWETVRDLTLQSTAPTLVYEEGSLIKRSIRDLYNKDIDEVLVAGDGGYEEAKAFMRMLMPSAWQEREALSRRAADLRPLRDREPARRHVPAGGAIALRRLHRAQPDRGAGRDRRQFRPRHARASHRGHRAQDQYRGRRGDRAAAQATRPSRADRHRLHRHGREAQQPDSGAPAQGSAQARPRTHSGRAYLAFRVAGDVAPAHPFERARKLDRQVPALRRLRARALGVVGGIAAPARAGGNVAQGRDA